MSITFTKMHGNGNDFILIDEMKETVIPDEMKAEFAVVYCDRKFGIGGDGVLFISPASAEGAAVKMRLFQPDGSEAEMCGNGIRCLAKFASDNGYAKQSSSRILPFRWLQSGWSLHPQHYAVQSADQQQAHLFHRSRSFPLFR